MIKTYDQALAHNARVEAGRRRRLGLPPAAEGQEQIPPDEGPETRLQARIRKFCEEAGLPCYTGSMAHRAHRPKGEQDHTILLPAGRVLFGESKSATGKIKPAQRDNRAVAKRLGHDIRIWTSFEAFVRDFTEAQASGAGASRSA